MDKALLLSRAARTEDERYLLARVLDKYEQFERRGVPVYTGFLSSQEQTLSEGLLHAAGVREGFTFWGGYEGAERRRLCFLPDWLEAPEPSAVRVLRCRFYHENALTHRDLLGSLMALGVARETLGDLLVSDRSADVLVTSTAADFLARNWESAGREALQVEEISPQELTVPEERSRVFRDTVSSLRLDAVTAAAFSLSRGKAAELIEGGRAQLNWRDCLKPDKAVAGGDTITVRGLGKCHVEEVGGLTKKSRCQITLKRYE